MTSGIIYREEVYGHTLGPVDISRIEQLDLLLPSGHKTLQLPPSSMGILLHGSCRPIEVLLIEEFRNVAQVSTAQIIREADQGVELVLCQLITMTTSVSPTASRELTQLKRDTVTYGNFNVVIDAFHKRRRITLQQTLTFLFGNRRGNAIAFRRRLTRMSVPNRLDALQICISQITTSPIPNPQRRRGHQGGG